MGYVSLFRPGKVFPGIFWLGRLDSNQRSRDQSPLPCRLATSHQSASPPRRMISSGRVRSLEIMTSFMLVRGSRFLFWRKRIVSLSSSMSSGVSRIHSSELSRSAISGSFLDMSVCLSVCLSVPAGPDCGAINKVSLLTQIVALHRTAFRRLRARICLIGWWRVRRGAGKPLRSSGCGPARLSRGCWLSRAGSNCRPQSYQLCALPLSYGTKGYFLPVIGCCDILLLVSGVSRREGGGRGEGTRTPDTRFWRPLLFRLSYTPLMIASMARMVRTSGIEPLTPGSSNRCSTPELRSRVSFQDIRPGTHPVSRKNGVRTGTADIATR